MDEETKEVLDAEVQDVDGANDENDAAVTDSENAKKAFEDQKKRAEKAEAEVARLKTQINTETEATSKPEEDKPTVKSGSLSEDDILIIASLKDKERVNMAREIAQMRKIPLSEALDTDLYKAWDKDKTATEKNEQARLGASTGSGAKKGEKSFTTPGVSDAEHKAMFKKRMMGGQ